jgi:DNA mismatch endonuclease (patch repair protein)
MAHRLGYRFRLHRKDLPGKPDLVFVSQKKVILVNGCFWHGHGCRNVARTPKTNTKYWTEKIRTNKKRDARNQAKLRSMGWGILVIWECEIDNADALRKRLISFLGRSSA